MYFVSFYVCFATLYIIFRCGYPQFEEAEKKRMKAEQLRQELKHKKQWDNLHAKNDAAARELEQLQVC